MDGPRHKIVPEREHGAKGEAMERNVGAREHDRSFIRRGGRLDFAQGKPDGVHHPPRDARPHRRG
jgi:hypothetical protein